MLLIRQLESHVRMSHLASQLASMALRSRHWEMRSKMPDRTRARHMPSRWGPTGGRQASSVLLTCTVLYFTARYRDCNTGRLARKERKDPLTCNALRTVRPTQLAAGIPRGSTAYPADERRVAQFVRREHSVNACTKISILSSACIMLLLSPASPHPTATTVSLTSRVCTHFTAVFFDTTQPRCISLPSLRLCRYLQPVATDATGPLYDLRFLACDTSSARHLSMCQIIAHLKRFCIDDSVTTGFGMAEVVLRATSGTALTA